MERFVRAVSVMHLPKPINPEAERVFLMEMREASDVNRPRIVLNCATLYELDVPTVRFLLHCLEEAMKRNGDVRLAALPDAAKAALQSAGLERLFRVFESDADAIKSFQQHSTPEEAMFCRSSLRAAAAENAA